MSIKAYATVRLTGCNIRRFINLCTANHIKIWNLKYVSPKEYEACCSTEDIFLMKPHLKKTHTRLLVAKRQGYFAIKAFLYKIRIITAAITGVFCIHALICTRIWHIVPEGNRFTYDDHLFALFGVFAAQAAGLACGGRVLILLAFAHDTYAPLSAEETNLAYLASTPWLCFGAGATKAARRAAISSSSTCSVMAPPSMSTVI